MPYFSCSSITNPPDQAFFQYFTAKLATSVMHYVDKPLLGYLPPDSTFRQGYNIYRTADPSELWRSSFLTVCLYP
jgi:hypothetical protein